MKSIAVVTNTNSKVSRFLKENLEIVFKDYVNINNYYLEELKDGDIIKDDVVMVMIREKAVEVKKYVEDSQKIIVVQRTIGEKEIYKLFPLPKNTKVLVVNDNIETTLETVSLFYQIGINHLNLVPYKEGEDYHDIKIAVSPGETHRVPDYIPEIIDVGNRNIDISTFIKIINRLGIDEKEVSKRLIRYSEEIITLDRGIKEQYKQLFIKNEELDIVINLSNEGILLTDNFDNILISNISFKKIFNLTDDVVGKSIDQILDDKIVEVFKKSYVKDELVEYKGKHIIINREIVKFLGQTSAFYYNIQEVTYIKQLEQSLSRKLRDKGLIARYTFNDIKTHSSSMICCIELAKKMSQSDLTVLITGESGTGKELLAQSIHNASKRAAQPFIAVNCAAVPENLLESELFGYEGGAFTGALKEGKMGLFEQAHNGTIFLDEIGDMPLSLQTKLLRVLQERQVMRIGSQRVTNINIRVIAATNKNLLEMVKKEEFRGDLYYRLNVLPIKIPSLKDRKHDIIPLLMYFLSAEKKLEIPEEVQRVLIDYPWPGNIRELQNVASYIALMNEKRVSYERLPPYILNSYENFDNEFRLLRERCDMEKSLEILKLIERFNNELKGVGRKNICEELSSMGISITEGEVRSILSSVRDMGFISPNVGRKGSEMTIKGKKFVNWMKNRQDI